MNLQTQIKLTSWLLLAAVAGSGQGVITTVAGTNWFFPSGPLPALTAPLGNIPGVAVDSARNVYVADSSNNLIFRVTPSGTLTVVAGNGVNGFSGDGGPATSASLDQPSGIAIDSSGNLYISDTGNNRIRMVMGGIITTVAGGGVEPFGDGGPGLATSASLNQPNGIAVDSLGNLYIADTGNDRIQKVSAGTMTTVAGGLPHYVTAGIFLSAPQGVAVDSAGSLYIADTGDCQVWKVSGGLFTKVAGYTCFVPGAPLGDGGPATSAALYSPEAVAVDANGVLYISDTDDHRVRKVYGGVITTIAGNGTAGFSGDGGPAAYASFNLPVGLALDAGGTLYIADCQNNRVRTVSGGLVSTIEYSGGIVSTIAGDGVFGFSGDGGSATGATLASPFAVAVDATGNFYIADSATSRVRKVSNGIIATVAGNGVPGFSGDGDPATSASLNSPSGVAVDSAGNIYIADTANNRVRKVSGGTITTVAGTGQVPGVSYYSGAGLQTPPIGDGGPATSGLLNQPQGLAVDSSGNLYIADTGDGLIRKVSNGVITTVAGSFLYSYVQLGDGGPATSGWLQNPAGIAVDSSGNLYIADTGNDRIRKVSGGIITTVAGGIGAFSGDGGLATHATLNSPVSVAVDPSGNLYIADTLDERVRKVSNGIITTIAGDGTPAFAGDGGSAANSSLNNPSGVALDSAGNLYIADTGNIRVREVLVSSATLTALPASLTFAGTAGGGAPGVQAVNVSSSLAGLAFAVTPSVPWLTITPSGGNAPSVLQVSVDPSQLSAGSFTGKITITASSGAATTVSVALSVSSGLPASLGVSPSAAALSVTQGSSATSALLSVSNQGGGSLMFTASASTSTGGNWLTVSPPSGLATPASPVSLTVTANPGSLMAGTYSGNIVVTGTSGNATVPVTLSVSGVQQTLLLSQTGLTFTGVAQGGSPLPQSFGILNTGQGSMNWTASATTLSGGAWLTIDQQSGSVMTPFTSVSLVNVTVNTAGLSAGNYYGQIQVTSVAANSPQLVTVALNVLPPGSSPGAELQPTGLIFIGEPGSSPGSQNVMISNPQNGLTTFAAGFLTVPTGGNWAQVAPLNATVPPNAPISMVVQPNYTGLASGVYQGFVNLGFLDGSSRSVHVLVVVAPGSGGGGAEGRAAVAPNASGTNSCAPLNVQPTTLSAATNTVTVGQAVPLQVKVVDNCGNPLTGGSVQATFTNGDSAVNLVSIGGGNWSGTWTPRNSASQVQINYLALEVIGTTPVSGTKSVSVLLVSSASPLTLGVVNAASQGGAYIAPGGLVSIYGSQLSGNSATSGNPPFSTNVNGTQVLLGGTPLPLRYVGSEQINAQVPFGLGINTEQQLVVVNGSTLSVPQNVAVAAAQPAIYTQDQSGKGPGVIVDANAGVEVTTSSPAHAGDVIVIYCNGLGAVDPAVPTGTAAPLSGPPSQTVNPVLVTIGGINALAQFAGLVPGYPDLYQVNAVVPPGTTGNLLPLVLTVAGQSSPPVTIAVQ